MGPPLYPSPLKYRASLCMVWGMNLRPKPQILNLLPLKLGLGGLYVVFSVTVQLYSWGSGASGQLGGGIEEIRIYPSPVASFSLSPTFRLSSPILGHLPSASVLLPSSFNEGKVDVEIGISCGLFHSALLVDGNLWIWGKGDGGRLGFGHENPVFVPTLNTYLDSVQSVALGGLHSIALNSLGQVITWGYGGFGALGHKVYHRELVPRLVEGSWDAEICHVATSGTHTAAITKSGRIFKHFQVSHVTS
ncbi:hypothetical protein MTR67_031965 [Solanum verrucosum]|uniref:Uncharacterized protein n=1 Tax=Solanum verrucosum TaxID=315347 RepID=A0AAF0U3H8_SOLVR|nr:hypothetical protein MTR67_031965 [Solanum verrucosum]